MIPVAENAQHARLAVPKALRRHVQQLRFLAAARSLTGTSTRSPHPVTMGTCPLGTFSPSSSELGEGPAGDPPLFFLHTMAIYGSDCLIA
jgi:hypothetical protein